MTELFKTRLIEMLDAEIKSVNADISNNNIWLKSCVTRQEQTAYIENIVDLEEYRDILSEMKRQVEEEGAINV